MRPRTRRNQIRPGGQGSRTSFSVSSSLWIAASHVIARPSDGITHPAVPVRMNQITVGNLHPKDSDSRSRLPLRAQIRGWVRLILPQRESRPEGRQDRA